MTAKAVFQSSVLAVSTFYYLFELFRKNFMSKDNSFKNFLANFAKILCLLAICVAFAFIFVFPLCKWCQISPKSYSLVILGLVLGFIIFRCVKSIIKRGIFNFSKIFVPAFELIVLIFLSLILIVNFQILWGLLVFLAAWILFAIIITIFNKKSKVNGKNEI